MDVERLASEMTAWEQAPLNTMTLLHAGVCYRALVLPEGVCAVGEVLSQPSTLLLFGDVTMAGEPNKRYKGFHVIPAQAGVQRAVYAHSDTFIITTSRTDAHTAEEAVQAMTGNSQRLLELGLLLEVGK